MTASLEIADLLRRNAGLDAGALGRGVLDRAVKKRVKQLHLASDGEYGTQLERSPAEMQHLVDDVVVHETSFFRDPGSFAAFGDWVLRKWLASRPSRSLNILSLPCSTGEEPCSIAMTLLDLNAGVRFRIDAIDISTRALKSARAGEYGTGSFRGKDLEYRSRYFDATSHGYRVRPEVVEHIDYRHGNLLRDSFAERTYDVVFCRNLLIYFDAESQARGMERLAALVNTGGLLFLGPAETFLAARTPFRSLGTPMTFGFEKTDGAIAAVRPAAAKTPAKPAAPKAVAPKSTAAPARRTSPAPRKSSPASSATNNEQLLTTAESLANAGKLDEAAELCRQYIAASGANAHASFLMGVVSDAQGNTQEAISWFRKTLYLEPGHEQALLHLSVLAQQSGGNERASHLNRRARAAGSEQKREDGA